MIYFLFARSKFFFYEMAVFYVYYIVTPNLVSRLKHEKSADSSFDIITYKVLKHLFITLNCSIIS